MSSMGGLGGFTSVGDTRPFHSARHCQHTVNHMLLELPYPFAQQIFSGYPCKSEFSTCPKTFLGLKIAIINTVRSRLFISHPPFLFRTSL